MALFSPSGQHDESRRTDLLGGVRQVSVCISVADLVGTADWYRQKLGFETVVEKEFPAVKSTVVFLRHGHLVLELLQADGSEAAPKRPDPPANGAVRGIAQLSLHVRDLDVALEAARRQDLPIVMDVSRVPDIGVAAFFISDPEDNFIEIFHADWEDESR